MTYPNYPPAPPQQGYPPQYPSQAYPPGPAQYPPPQYPSQAYPPAPPPPQPLPRATVADFYDQPAGGAKPLQFPDRAYGTSYTAVIARPVTDADIQVQTDKQNQPRRFRDGTLMKVMILPLLMNPSAEYPDGTASFYVKGNDTAELKRALGEAGLDAGKPPPQGTVITVTYTHDRPVPGGFNPAKIKRITCQRPQGMPPVQQAPDPAQQAQAQAAIPNSIRQMAPQGPGAPANFANPGGHYQVPPGPTVPGATMTPTGAPAAASPYPMAPPAANPVPAPDGQPPFAPPYQPPAQPHPVQGQGMQGPGAQVAAATQAALAAGAQHQPPVQPQQPAPMAPPPGMSPENAALLAQLTGQPARQP